MSFGNTPETLFVEDKNCNPADPERAHEMIIDGVKKVFPFQYGKRREMPFGHAMKFLVDDAFEVTDEGGKRYMPIPKPEKGGAGGLVLKPGEVVARLDELLKDALHARCAMAPGGESVPARASREDMIGFLEGVNIEALHANRERDDGVEPGADTEGMSQSELDRMLPKPELTAG